MSRDLPSADAVNIGGGTVQQILREPEASVRGDRAKEGVGLPYLPGLDGLRALAVIAVLLYHAGLPWLPGGFLGVEVFFVISGYLITALLLAEQRQRGRIDIKGFWFRRARRLLPALYLVLAATLAFAVVFLPEEVAGLREDALAAFGYVTNWYLILANESYFEAVGRPSLLQHLWSLAVEEQFYLLWPLLFTATMALASWMLRWGRHVVLLAVLLGAAASALLMAALYQPDADPSRIYYGTDTRAAGLLLGAALAFVWAPGRPGRSSRRTSPLLLDALGLAALGGLVVFCLLLNQYQPFLYRGGFALVALTTAAVIMLAVHPRARLLGTGLLGRQPLRWIGLRSYGIYLWHWPVFMVTRPELDVPIDGLGLLVVRLAATVVLADLSYRYVETPIRRGALGRAWRTLRAARGVRRWRLGVRWTGAVGMSAAFSVALGVAVVQAQPPAAPSYLSVESIHTEGSADLETETPEPAVVKDETAPATAPAGASADPVTVIGDSVILGAAGELERAIGNPAFATEVGLQPVGAIEILKKRRAAGRLGEAVVIHVGNNVPYTSEQFDEMMQLLTGVRKVVIVNLKVPRPWEQSNNDMLADGVRRYPNTVLVDWHAASAGRPDLFVGDGIHLRPEGQRIYADLIAAQLPNKVARDSKSSASSS